MAGPPVTRAPCWGSRPPGGTGQSDCLCPEQVTSRAAGAAQPGLKLGESWGAAQSEPQEATATAGVSVRPAERL